MLYVVFIQVNAQIYIWHICNIESYCIIYIIIWSYVTYTVYLKYILVFFLINKDCLHCCVQYSWIANDNF